MNDFDLKALAVSLLTLAMGLLSWIGRMQVRRLDRLEKELHELAEEAVKKEDMEKMHNANDLQLKEILRRLEKQDGRSERHRELVTQDLERIRSNITVIRTRLGQLPFHDDTGSHRKPGT